MVKITVPASSANLGSGFDALGIALSLCNVVWMREQDGCKIESADGVDIPAGEDNMVYSAAKTLYSHCGRPFRGLYIRQQNNIPMTRGLGSSSACLIAGLTGANTLLGSPLSRSDICDMAAGIEGHPDNVAPALLGGLVTAVMEAGRVHTVSVPVPDTMRFAVFIPPFELCTKKARAALPQNVTRADAVYNLSRAALMTASLFSGNMDSLRVAVQDRLHQPYRMGMIPGADTVFYTAYECGAHAVAISGAGPSILSVIDSTNADFTENAYQQLCRAGLKDWSVEIFSCREQGAEVEFIA